MGIVGKISIHGTFLTGFFGCPRVTSLLPQKSFIYGSCARYVSNVCEGRDHSSYRWFLPFQTRFADNDRYGHVNNAVYHAIFDSVINIFLIRHCGLDIHMKSGSTVGFMVTNQCQFFAPAAYPQVYLVGLGLSKIGKTSLSYQLGMFPPKQGTGRLVCDMTHGYTPEELNALLLSPRFQDEASCVGRSVHVFVDTSKDNKPTAIPEEWLPVLSNLQI